MIGDRFVIVFWVVSAQEMLASGADPETWFGLTAEPGYVFVDAGAGPFLRPSPILGASGQLPSLMRGAGTAKTPGFVAWGRGIRGGVLIPSMRLTDVAPTAALLLGTALPEAASLDGRPLIGVLALPAVSSGNGRR